MSNHCCMHLEKIYFLLNASMLVDKNVPSKCHHVSQCFKMSGVSRAPGITHRLVELGTFERSPERRRSCRWRLCSLPGDVPTASMQQDKCALWARAVPSRVFTTEPFASELLQVIWRHFISIAQKQSLVWREELLFVLYGVFFTEQSPLK